MGTALGVLAAAAVTAGLILWWTSIQRVELAERRWVVNSLIWAGSGAGLIALSLHPSTLGTRLAGTSIVIGVVYSVLLAISGQSKQAPIATLGAPLPEFTATDENGEVFRSADLRGSPVLIKFFRGHW